jgi:UDP-N-acetylmuramoyl-tripeptide--D-alanyl-D-alanine ligase
MKSFFKKIIVWILTLEAKIVLKKYKPDIIAITGSVGKTSTKDAIYSLISESSAIFVRKSQKSFNSEIGLPLTILGCDNAWSNPLAWLGNIARGLSLIMYRSEYPKCLVLEVGADHPGDIKKLGRWFHPDVVVITAVSKVPVHVEFFSSPRAVLEEKLALAKAIKPKGTLILPAADSDILAVRKDPALAGVKCLTFSINSSGDVTATNVKISYTKNGTEKKSEESNGSGKPVGMFFRLNYAGNSVPVSISGVVGLQHVYAMVAAVGATVAYGQSFDAITAAIPHHHAPAGRMNVLSGINGSILIDDTYNASPDAVKEALAVLCDVNPDTDASVGRIPKSVRKIAVLGDMMELGAFSLEEHKKIGEIAVHALMSLSLNEISDVSGDSRAPDSTRGNILVTVGIRARDIVLGAIAAGMSKEAIHSFDSSTAAAEYMKTIVGKAGNDGGKNGDVIDVILIKGSQSSRMERITRALLVDVDGTPADDELAAQLLVRQDPEWLAKV